MPVRVELGPKDLANNACVLARRDLPGKEAKEMDVPLAAAPARIGEMLHADAERLARAARGFRESQQFRGEFLRGIQEKDRGSGWLSLGPLGRNTGNRGPDIRRNESHDSLHSVLRPKEQAAAWSPGGRPKVASFSPKRIERVAGAPARRRYLSWTAH